MSQSCCDAPCATAFLFFKFPLSGWCNPVFSLHFMHMKPLYMQVTSWARSYVFSILLVVIYYRDSSWFLLWLHDYNWLISTLFTHVRSLSVVWCPCVHSKHHKISAMPEPQWIHIPGSAGIGVVSHSFLWMFFFCHEDFSYFVETISLNRMNLLFFCQFAPEMKCHTTLPDLSLDLLLFDPV